ncbi:MAG: hypothetical protein Q8P15_02345 [Nanoarchaeota archaeon]|nr:hypothetical protein [Nanoarchaeota archaeon]
MDNECPYSGLNLCDKKDQGDYCHDGNFQIVCGKYKIMKMIGNAHNKGLEERSTKIAPELKSSRIPNLNN